MTGRDEGKGPLFVALLEQRDRLTAVLFHIIRTAGPGQAARLQAIINDEMKKEI